MQIDRQSSLSFYGNGAPVSVLIFMVIVR